MALVKTWQIVLLAAIACSRPTTPQRQSANGNADVQKTSTENQDPGEYIPEPATVDPSTIIKDPNLPPNPPSNPPSNPPANPPGNPPAPPPSNPPANPPTPPSNPPTNPPTPPKLSAGGWVERVYSNGFHTFLQGWACNGLDTLTSVDLYGALDDGNLIFGKTFQAPGENGVYRFARPDLVNVCGSSGAETAGFLVSLNTLNNAWYQKIKNGGKIGVAVVGVAQPVWLGKSWCHMAVPLDSNAALPTFVAPDKVYCATDGSGVFGRSEIQDAINLSNTVLLTGNPNLVYRKVYLLPGKTYQLDAGLVIDRDNVTLSTLTLDGNTASCYDLSQDPSTWGDVWPGESGYHRGKKNLSCATLEMVASNKDRRMLEIRGFGKGTLPETDSTATKLKNVVIDHLILDGKHNAIGGDVPFAWGKPHVSFSLCDGCSFQYSAMLRSSTIPTLYGIAVPNIQVNYNYFSYTDETIYLNWTETSVPAVNYSHNMRVIGNHLYNTSDGGIDFLTGGRNIEIAYNTIRWPDWSSTRQSLLEPKVTSPRGYGCFGAAGHAILSCVGLKSDGELNGSIHHNSIFNSSTAGIIIGCTHQTEKRWEDTKGTEIVTDLKVFNNTIVRPNDDYHVWGNNRHMGIFFGGVAGQNVVVDNNSVSGGRHDALKFVYECPFAGCTQGTKGSNWTGTNANSFVIRNVYGFGGSSSIFPEAVLYTREEHDPGNDYMFLAFDYTQLDTNSSPQYQWCLFPGASGDVTAEYCAKHKEGWRLGSFDSFFNRYRLGDQSWDDWGFRFLFVDKDYMLIQAQDAKGVANGRCLAKIDTKLVTQSCDPRNTSQHFKMLTIPGYRSAADTYAFEAKELLGGQKAYIHKSGFTTANPTGEAFARFKLFSNFVANPQP